MINKLTLFICLISIFASTAAMAQESDNAISAKLLIEGGVEYGGDELLKVFFTNGGDQTMLAGQGLYIAAGGHFQFTSKILFRATVGIKYNTTAADNANIRLTRVPINLIGYWAITNDIRLGVGAASHQLVRFKGDNVVDDVDFTSAIGPRIEIGYKFVALTYTAVNYISELDEEFSASSFRGFFIVPGK